MRRAKQVYGTMDYACYGCVGGVCLGFFLDRFGHVYDVYSSSWLFCKCLHYSPSYAHFCPVQYASSPKVVFNLLIVLTTVSLSLQT
jgi:hypothetical protein